MASTYRTIEELYRTTLVALSESPEAWKAFLESAGRNYKLPFPEQALVHAQRPDARRCWNWSAGMPCSAGG